MAFGTHFYCGFIVLSFSAWAEMVLLYANRHSLTQWLCLMYPLDWDRGALSDSLCEKLAENELILQNSVLNCNLLPVFSSSPYSFFGILLFCKKNWGKIMCKRRFRTSYTQNTAHTDPFSSTYKRTYIYSIFIYYKHLVYLKTENDPERMHEPS